MTERELVPLFVDKPLNQKQAERLADVIKVIADPSRLQILSLLSATTEPLRPIQVEAVLGLAQSTVGHHVRTLARAKLLTRTRVGGAVYVRLASGAVARLAEVLR